MNNRDKPKSPAQRTALSEALYRLGAFMKRFNGLDAGLAKRCSDATAAGRAQVLRQGFRILHQLGYKLRDPANFANRHMQVLAMHWEEAGLSASEIQRRFSMFRAFAAWIGKAGMIGPAGQYLRDPARARRSYVARTPKGWTGLGVDVEEKLAHVADRDRRVAVQLALQWAFGLRAREAWLLHPRLADRGTHLAVNWGTKGGRQRTVPITEPIHGQLLELAKRWANESTGSLIPDGRSLKAWKAHFYRVCRDCGIARATGFVAHGLRHDFANAIYKSLVGVDAPVYGGDKPVLDRNGDRLVRQVVAEHLGHSRPQISGMYLGAAARDGRIGEGR